ncbi:MAG: RdgB/HAM1 family non-canonical purine NTP pyrophosphatase [Spartobacteria bacterium]
MLPLLLATRNAHKTREFSEILGEPFRVTDLSHYSNSPVVEETGKTFAENAILKALAVPQLRHSSRAEDRPAFARLWRGRHLLVVADDSGLEVDALDGAPGIYSARFAGEHATDVQNVDRLLSELKGRDPRNARFRCVIALARDGTLLQTFEGTAEGVIVDLARGSNGFGYDPIFVPSGFDKTFAELPREIKNRISHRAKAIEQLREMLRREN